MASNKPSDAAVLMLGISKPQIASMQRKVDQLERENDAIALTRIRHAVSQKLVEIRLLLRDGNLRSMNGGTRRYQEVPGGTRRHQELTCV
jgi:hypothetical protein